MDFDQIVMALSICNVLLRIHKCNFKFILEATSPLLFISDILCLIKMAAKCKNDINIDKKQQIKEKKLVGYCDISVWISRTRYYDCLNSAIITWSFFFTLAFFRRYLLIKKFMVWGVIIYICISVLIFVVIITTFQPLYSLTFFRYLSLDNFQAETLWWWEQGWEHWSKCK